MVEKSEDNPASGADDKHTRQELLSTLAIKGLARSSLYYPLKLLGMLKTKLRRALVRRGPQDKPILHSDRCWHYRMPVYREALEQRALVPEVRGHAEII
jgi:hypothetical protein